MIELQQLSKRYGDRLAVDDLTFTIPTGLVTGFLGPNGAGKSTTMRMILGLDWPTSGRVLLNGSRYDQLVAPLTHVGALLEAKAAQQGRSAYNHLLWLARSNRIPDRRVVEVLDIVGLQDVARKRIGGFSLGMGQRLGIAAALLGDPAVLLFDEPVNGLDPEGIVWIRTLMKSLAAEGRTVFVSSHLMSEMALTADHLIVIGRGRLLADLPMGEFIDRNSRSHVRILTDQPEALMDALDGDAVAYRRGADGAFEAVGVEPSRIAKLASKRGLVLTELSLQRASLEEAFMDMTADAVEYHAGPATSAAATAASAAPTTSEHEQRKQG
jgi:ABC-2 type transport system ATP-binding protein